MPVRRMSAPEARRSVCVIRVRPLFVGRQRRLCRCNGRTSAPRLLSVAPLLMRFRLKTAARAESAESLTPAAGGPLSTPSRHLQRQRADARCRKVTRFLSLRTCGCARGVVATSSPAVRCVVRAFANRASTRARRCFAMSGRARSRRYHTLATRSAAALGAHVRSGSARGAGEVGHASSRARCIPHHRHHYPPTNPAASARPCKRRNCSWPVIGGRRAAQLASLAWPLSSRSCCGAAEAHLSLRALQRGRTPWRT